MVFWATVLPSEAKGEEQTHDRPNPWLVVSKNAVHRKVALVQAVPFTSKTYRAEGAAVRKFRIQLELSRFTLYDLPAGQVPLTGTQVALTEQCRVLAHGRLLGNPIAKLSDEGIAVVEAGLRYVLAIP